MLNGTPRPRSHERWYIRHERSGFGDGLDSVGGGGRVT